MIWHTANLAYLCAVSTHTTLSETIDCVMRQAEQAADAWRNTQPVQRADFMEAIATEIEALGRDLIAVTMAETHLSEARLQGERTRTTGQLRMYASMLREGSWVEATIDTAQEGRPDLRKMLMPLGPVVVFGASNFPYAYSTAGGDTASALAAGCPVVVKAHPAHPRTSRIVAEAIERAIAKCQVPAHVFQHVDDAGYDTGKLLVLHPYTRAVGFTGSLSGGMALYSYAQQRPDPIPVFAEMGSVNPVIVLPEALSKHGEAIARTCAASVTLGVGQFCTNPGLILGIDCAGLRRFVEVMGQEVAQVAAAPMLHDGILRSYSEKRSRALAAKGVFEAGSAPNEDTEHLANATIAWVSGEDFLRTPHLHEEVFGPFSLIVLCRDATQMQDILQSLGGQLTCSIWAEPTDLQIHTSLLALAQRKAGRIILNGVPTGVTVAAAMMHGGPFPATTDSRFTAVGIHAVRRWVRPVCFQNFHEAFLPEALKNRNTLGIWRLINGQWNKEDVT